MQNRKQVSYREILNRLLFNSWDWVYFSHLEAHDVTRQTSIDNRTHHIPEKLWIAIHDGDNVEEVEIENPPGGVGEAYSRLLKNDGRTIYKAKKNPRYFNEFRAYQPHHKIPSHIIARGVEFPWD